MSRTGLRASAEFVKPGLADHATRPGFPRRSIRKLLMPLMMHVGTTAQNLRADSAGFWRLGEDRYWLPRVIFRGASETDDPVIRLAIFAGIHGDEPAGIHAVVDLLRALDENPFVGRAYRIHIYPLCNPTGYEDNSRRARSGKDLNREFWHGSLEPEVGILERELLLNKFHGIISLHSDDTSDGVYGFVRGHTLTQHLLKPALAAAEATLPVNQATVIDGFHAVEGIIHSAYDGILSAPPGSTPAPFEIILESPQHAAMELQRRALAAALLEIIRRYRRVVSFAEGI